MTTMRAISSSGLLVLLLLTGAAPVRAQPEPRRSAPSLCREAPAEQLFAGALGGFRQLPSRQSVGIVAFGTVAALTAHSVDRNIRDHFADRTANDSAFRPGAVIGSTPFQLGAGLAVYGFARAGGHPCAAAFAADLVQGQLVAEGLTLAIKQSTRRSRPDGSNFSFPSGHTAAAFASATVLERHFGWKIGVPAYAVASYVAVSRIEMRRHYLSDIAFGAAVGIVAGRAVTVGGQRLMLTPMAAADGSGVGLGFTWIGPN